MTTNNKDNTSNQNQAITNPEMAMAAAAQVRFVRTADLSHWFHESPVWDQATELNYVPIHKKRDRF